MPAYALYTDALVRAMGLDDPAAAGMHEYRETFESVGEVVGWVTDLGAAWEEERRRERTKVTDDDALAVITIPAAVPRDILWEWATSPARRIRWTSGMTDVVEDLAERTAGGRHRQPLRRTARTCPSRRSSTGSRPSTRRSGSRPRSRAFPRIVITTELIARGPDQTDLVYRVARPRSLKDRLILQAMEGQFRTAVVRDSATLIELAAADAAERAAGRATEPDVPASTARHLSAPLAATGGPIAYLPDDGGAG